MTMTMTEAEVFEYHNKLEQAAELSALVKVAKRILARETYDSTIVGELRGLFDVEKVGE